VLVPGILIVVIDEIVTHLQISSEILVKIAGEKMLRYE